MSFESTLVKHIAFPLSDIVRGTHSIKCFHELEKTQWLSPTQIEDLQQKKLHDLLVHAYENVPYYRKMFKEIKLKPDDIKSIDDLSKLPFLTKEIIRKNFPHNITPNNYNKSQLIKFCSGGTTGEPLISYKDNNAISWGLGATYRGWSWSGYRLGDRYAMLWRSPDTIEEYSKLYKRIENFTRRNIFLPSFDMNKETLFKHVRQLRKYKPKVIRASPSAAYILAKFMEYEGIDDIKPNAILTTADKLYDFQRETIESQFGCDIFDGYGSNEIRLIAFECEEHNGYHISAENVIVEFIKDGEHVAPSELGEIVITDLNNYAMPFIRYKIGDVGIPSDELCSCGRGLPLMRSVEGRLNNFVITPEGRLLSSSFFIDLFRNIEFIKEFRVIQETKENIIIKIVSESKLNEKETANLVEHVRKNIGDIKMIIDYADSIPPTKSGKLQLVVSKVPINF